MGSQLVQFSKKIGPRGTILGPNLLTQISHASSKLKGGNFFVLLKSTLYFFPPFELDPGRVQVVGMVFLTSFHHLLSKTWRADIISVSRAKYILNTFSGNTNDKGGLQEIIRNNYERLNFVQKPRMQ